MAEQSVGVCTLSYCFATTSSPRDVYKYFTLCFFQNKKKQQAEAEVVQSSSLVKIEVEVGVWVEVELIKRNLLE